MTIYRRGLSGIDLSILRLLDDGPFEGLTRMAETLQCNDRRYVRSRLRRLLLTGAVVMEYPAVPCRGNRVVIRKAKGK